MKTRVRNLTNKEKLRIGEKIYFENLLKKFPKGILSIVSDTFDLWEVLTIHLVSLKEKIIARDGKIVIRPDSGDPVDIICGKSIPKLSSFEEAELYFVNNINGNLVFEVNGKFYKVIIHSECHFRYEDYELTPEDKGVIQLLYEVFGGTKNGKGFIELPHYIGAIYGDSITLERCKQICERLILKGFASTNVVFGIGSYTYQYNTRDTFGWAMKATYVEVERFLMAGDGSGFITEGREIFKDPVTDDGTKKSAKGLLRVVKNENDELILEDQCTWEEEATGLLETVFEDGKFVKETSLQEIRDRLKSYHKLASIS